MGNIFGSTYTGIYDYLYQDKDYAAECDLIETLLSVYGSRPTHSLLDLGCGTGNHALPLAERGYRVVGVDRSEGMLSQARAKVATTAAKERVEFYPGDVRTVDLQQMFDAALMMFAVLGYQLENADVLAALRTVRRHLQPGGLFIFDVWYGPAVLTIRPSERLKVIPTSTGRVLRVASSSLDTRHHTCDVRYHVWRLDSERLTGEVEEVHTMRFFFPRELEFFLECAGLALLRLGTFMDFERDPDETTWNVIGVARAS